MVRQNEMQFSKSKKKNGFIDRRVFARLPMKLPLRFLEKGREKEGKAQTVDISANGIGLIGKRKLSPNTPLEICLDTPDHFEPLHIVGSVIWSKSLEADTPKWRAGVHLEKVNLVDLGRIYYRKSGLP